MQTTTEKIQKKIIPTWEIKIIIFFKILIIFLIFFAWRFFLWKNLNLFLNFLLPFFIIFIYKFYNEVYKNSAFITETKIIFQKKWKLEKYDISKIKELKIIKKHFLSNFLNFRTFRFIWEDFILDLDYIENSQENIKEISEILKKSDD